METEQWQKNIFFGAERRETICNLLYKIFPLKIFQQEN